MSEMDEMPESEARRVDHRPAPMGGREWVRTLSCAHCGSADVTGLVPDLTLTSVGMRYRCEVCRLWTLLTAQTHDGGRVYITRVGLSAQ